MDFSPTNRETRNQPSSGLSVNDIVLLIVVFVGIFASQFHLFPSHKTRAITVEVALASSILSYILWKSRSGLRTNSQRSSSEKSGSIRPVIFILGIMVSLFLDIVVVPKVPDTNLGRLLEHLSIGLFVASSLGATFEFFINNKRDEQYRAYADELYGKLEVQFVNSNTVVDPDDIFGLLRDIAMQVKEVPTLYRPPRNQGSEYTFASNLEYFDKVLAIRREKVVGILRHWIQDTSGNCNLKFLASDFVGKYRIYELAELLRNEASVQRNRWEDLNKEEKSWVLNYIWAYSRLERPCYKTLGELLSDDTEEWIKKWILFIPRQMPDPDFLPVVEQYLEASQGLSAELRKDVEGALEALQRAGVCRASDLRSKYSRLWGLSPV